MVGSVLRYYVVTNNNPNFNVNLSGVNPFYSIGVISGVLVVKPSEKCDLYEI